jgi:hypothetical protein
VGSKGGICLYVFKFDVLTCPREGQTLYHTSQTEIRFSKQGVQEGEGEAEVESESSRLTLDYTGQFAFFDIGGVNNDPKGHFSISSSPTEDFTMVTIELEIPLTNTGSPHYKKKSQRKGQRTRGKIRLAWRLL